MKKIYNAPQIEVKAYSVTDRVNTISVASVESLDKIAYTSTTVYDLRQ